MFVKMNPIIDIARIDEVGIKKTIRVFNELAEAVAYGTYTDEGAIICADNGEVLVTEKELYEVLNILNNMDRIFGEAPQSIDGAHKELAIKFIE